MSSRVSERECPGCVTVKPREEFNVSRRESHGMQTRCRACSNIAKLRRRRAAGILPVTKLGDEELRRRALERGRRRPHRGEAYLEYQRQYQRSGRDPQKAKARGAVASALRSGKVIRPESCSRCDAECKPHGHHHSYEPEHGLDVEWLCVPCHVSEHEVSGHD